MNSDITKETGISAARNRRALVAILCILIFSMIISIIISTRAQLAGGTNRMNGEVGHYHDQVELWITEQKSILDMFTSFISASPDMVKDYEGTVRWLEVITSRYEDISASYIGNPAYEHQIIMNNGWEPDDFSWHVEERPWYISALNSGEPDGFSITSPYFDSQTGIYCVTLSKRVYDENNNFVGIFGIDFYLDKLTGILSSSYSGSGYAFLADRDGMIINHPNREYELAPESGCSIERAGYLEAAYSDRPVTIRDYDGKRKVALSVAEEHSGFRIICIRNWEMIYGSIIGNDLLFIMLFGLSIAGILYVIRDLIRWQDNANAILRESMDAAVRADTAKTYFLAQMSHEIRTPINAILGMDEMIVRESSEDVIKGYARDIQSAGASLLSIINDILDLTKIGSGKLSIVPVRYNLPSMLHDLVNMIRIRAEEKNLELEVNVDPMLPSWLYGDDVRVKQVITNIMTNAVKYTPAGRVTFRVSGRNTGNVCELYVEVEDTGIGIREENLYKIFSAFERIDDEKYRNIEGTGLGINITQKLLVMMGSSLGVESTYGKGSRFYFRLRQDIMDASPIGDFNRRVDEARDESHQSKSSIYVPGARFLVVDDNKLNLKVFRSLLKNTGAKIIEAASGSESLILSAREHFDIIFMDHMMPGMDGIETLRVMRSDKNSPNLDTPVFVLTANAVSGAREMYLKEGFNGFLAKPLVYDKLEAVIRETIPDKLAADRDDADEGAAHAGFDAEDYPVIGGIDWSYAYAHLNDDALIRSTVEEVIGLESYHLGQLSLAYDKIVEEKSFTDYQIQVHSLKSVAATLGIIPLAGMAAVLEYAARDEKYEDIEKLHPIFADRWSGYVKKLDETMGSGSKSGLLEAPDMDVVKDKLLWITECMENFDIDGADRTIDELLTYRFDDELDARLKELKTAVTAFDDEGAARIVRELTKEPL